MKGLWFAVVAAATIVVAPAHAAVFYGYAGSIGHFYTIKDSPVQEKSAIEATYCSGIICQSGSRFDNDSGGIEYPTKIAYGPGQTFTEWRGARFGASAFSTDGFRISPSGADRLVSFTLPEYTAGSYLYAYVTQFGSFATVLPGPLTSSVTFPAGNCSGEACRYTIDNAAGTVFTQADRPYYIATPTGSVKQHHYVTETNYFRPNSFNQPGISLTAQTIPLFVIALPDAYATGAVPEPATWVMMLAGFGIVGVAMRGQSKVRNACSPSDTHPANSV